MATAMSEISAYVLLLQGPIGMGIARCMELGCTLI